MNPIRKLPRPVLLPAWIAAAVTLLAPTVFGKLAPTVFGGIQAVTVTWSPTGAVDASVPLAGISSTPHITSASLTLSPNVAGISATDEFAGTGWPSGPRSVCHYVELSMTIAPGHRIAAVGPTSMEFKIHDSVPGTASWELRGGHNGFASVLGAGTVADVSLASATSIANNMINGAPHIRTWRLRLYVFDVGPTDRRGLLGSAGGGLDVTLSFYMEADPNLLDLASWNLQGTIDSAAPLAPSATASNVTAGPLQRAPALGPMTRIDAFWASGWPTGPRDDSRYLEFSITPVFGRAVSCRSISFFLGHSTTLFNWSVSWELRTSVDGYATALSGGSASSSGGDSAVTALVHPLGVRPDTVTFRLYFFDNGGANATWRGLENDGVGSFPQPDGLRIDGWTLPAQPAYPGTGEDLVTDFSIPGSTSSGTYINVAPGQIVDVLHRSPGGTFAGTGPVTVIASTVPAASTFPTLYPGIHVNPLTSTNVFSASIAGNPVTLAPQGLGYVFVYPGGLAGTSGLIQCVVLDPAACNGFFASTDGLELRFQ